MTCPPVPFRLPLFSHSAAFLCAPSATSSRLCLTRLPPLERIGSWSSWSWPKLPLLFSFSVLKSEHTQPSTFNSVLKEVVNLPSKRCPYNYKCFYLLEVGVLQVSGLTVESQLRGRKASWDSLVVFYCGEFQLQFQLYRCGKSPSSQPFILTLDHISYLSFFPRLPPSLILLLLLVLQQIPFSFHLFTHGCFRVPLRNALGIITKHVLWICADSSHNGDNQGCMNGDVNEWRSLALQIKWVDTRLFCQLLDVLAPIS